MASLEEIEKKQKDIQPLLKKIQEEKDPKEILRLADEIKERTQGLEKMAKKLEADILANTGHNPSGETRIILTKDQKERVTKATGVGLESIVIRGDADFWGKKMPDTQKRVIEQLAIKQASEQALERETRKAVEKILKELKKIPDPVPELQDLIAQIEADPTLKKGLKMPEIQIREPPPTEKGPR